MAAGQSRLSKFEAVECSKIGHLWPYQLTLPAVYQLTLHGWYDENMDVLAKLMDYMPSKFNTLKSQYYSLYLTIVGLFDVYTCSVFTMKVETSCWLFYFRSEKSLFSIYRVLSLPPTSRYFHRMCKTYLLMNGSQKFSGFTGIYTVRGPVSTNLAYQLTLPSPTCRATSMTAVLLPRRKPACSSGSSYSIFSLIRFSNMMRSTLLAWLRRAIVL